MIPVIAVFLALALRFYRDSRDRDIQYCRKTILWYEQQEKKFRDMEKMSLERAQRSTDPVEKASRTTGAADLGAVADEQARKRRMFVERLDSLLERH
jgi:hypothetical protein